MFFEEHAERAVPHNGFDIGIVLMNEVFGSFGVGETLIESQTGYALGVTFSISPKAVLRAIGQWVVRLLCRWESLSCGK